MKSKTIIISSQNEKSRGILTLFQEEDLLKCRLRLYSTPKLSRYCKLGVYHNKEVYSSNLLEKNGVYESSMVGNFDIDQDFYTAIVDTSNNNEVILSGGTYAGFFFNNQEDIEKDIQNNHFFEKIQKTDPNTDLYDYPEKIKPTINSQVNELTFSNKDKCEDCYKCLNCKYKEYFYQEQNASNQNISLVENDIKIEDFNQNINKENIKQNDETNQQEVEQKSIIQAIMPQFKYVFENYNADEILNSLIPNSKFVKINENQEEYSIGAIYENDEMKYICYAIMCNYNTPAPQELGSHYQWLPLDKEDPLSEGYYIVFQDAKDLKIVEL